MGNGSYFRFFFEWGGRAWSLPCISIYFRGQEYTYFFMVWCLMRYRGIVSLFIILRGVFENFWLKNGWLDAWKKFYALMPLKMIKFWASDIVIWLTDMCRYLISFVRSNFFVSSRFTRLFENYSFWDLFYYNKLPHTNLIHDLIARLKILIKEHFGLAILWRSYILMRCSLFYLKFKSAPCFLNMKIINFAQK